MSKFYSEVHSFVCGKMVLVRPDENKLSNMTEQQTSVKVKIPKRILHFSDGVLEEYSTDEEVETPEQPDVNPSSLTWGPWMLYKAWSAGFTTLSAVDTVGEFFASIFGITTPRYYFELEEYKKREEEQAKDRENEQTWSQPSATSVSMPLKGLSDTSSQPIDV